MTELDQAEGHQIKPLAPDWLTQEARQTAEMFNPRPPDAIVVTSGSIGVL